MTPPNFQRLFEGAPGLYLVMAPDLTIVAVSDAYLKATMTRREDIVGHEAFEIFPDNPGDPDNKGEANVRASLMRALRSKKPDTIPVIKYDIRKPTSEGGGFEERYWMAVNSPLLDAQGDVVYLIHRVEDLTESVKTSRGNAVAAVERNTVAAAAPRQVRMMNSWLAAALSALLCLPIFLFDLATPQGIAAGFAYIPFLFCSLWFPRPKAVFIFAAIASALVVTGYFVSPPGPVLAWIVLSNRALAIGALWFVAALIYRQRRIEESLHGRENQLSAVLEHTAEGMVTIGEGGIIQTFNKASERLFGYSAAEVIGQNVKMLMPEPNRSQHDGYLARYRKTGEGHIIGTVGREVEGVRKDGTVFPLELSVSAVSVEGRRIFSGILRDISARKEAEKKLAHMAAIIESSADAIISKTSDGIITSWNPAAEKLFGYSAAEVLGRHINMIVPPEQQAEEIRILEEVHQGRRIENYEAVRIAKGGRPVEVSVSISPIKDKNGRVIGASKISRDISERRAIDRRLQKAVTDLKRSNEELESFTYIASHDLKEPLRGIASNVRFLKEDCGAALNESALKRLSRMHYLCQRLEKLVDDLLYFSRIGRQELAIRNTDLNAVVKDVEVTMESTLHEANVRIVIPEPLPAVTCDATRITEVFRNLIANAVKYNKNEEKLIEIGCAEKTPPDGGIPQRAFYVRDNGIGIAPEFHREVFRLFKRLNTEDDSIKGTGVGLTIVQKIIERHRGRIWVESAEGEGTTFYFTLNNL